MDDAYIFIFDEFWFIILYFIKNLVDFLNNENLYIEKHLGLSNHFIDLLNKQKADKNHNDTCPIL